MVTPHDVFALDDDFAAFAVIRQLAGVFVSHNGDFNASRLSDRAREARTRRKRTARHLVRGLRHSVRLEDRCAETVFEGVEYGGSEGGGAGADDAERFVGRVVFIGARQEYLVDGWNRGVPSRVGF